MSVETPFAALPDRWSNDEWKFNSNDVAWIPGWVNTDSCFNFSLAGRASRDLSIEVHWIDSEDDTSYIDTGIDLTSSWQEFDPVDLSHIPGSTWDGNVVKFWLEFGRGNIPATIRIGWIKLTD